MHITTRTRAAIQISGCLLLLGVIGYIVLNAAFTAYLRSVRFHQQIEASIARSLGGAAYFAPFEYSGSAVYMASGTVTGGGHSWFHSLVGEGVRAEIEPYGLFQGKFRIREVALEQLRLELGSERSALLRADGPEATSNLVDASWGGKVEVRAGRVDQLDVIWPGGSLKRSVAKLSPQGGGWRLEATEGVLAHAQFPSAHLEQVRMHIGNRSLEILEATLHPDGGGNIEVTGNVWFRDRADLHATLDKVPLLPYLAGDWRYRVAGEVSGRIAIGTALGSNVSEPLASGTLFLTDGSLTALPILDQIALFTRTDRFRRLELTKAQAVFARSPERLRLSEIVCESPGLIRVEGNMDIARERLDGVLRVGINPSTLGWLPSARDRVFQENRDGYVWTDVRVTGTPDAPVEDLTPRLVQGMQDEVIDQTGRTIRGAAEKAIDMLKPLLQGR